MMKTKKEIDQLTFEVLGAAIEVHRNLGPGLLEKVYHKFLMLELRERGIAFESEFVVFVNYKGVMVEADLRCDLLVEDTLVVELKSVEAFAPVFTAITMTYMKLLAKPKGLLINFNSYNLFKDGQKTFVNDYYRNFPDK